MKGLWSLSQNKRSSKSALNKIEYEGKFSSYCNTPFLFKCLIHEVEVVISKIIFVNSTIFKD